MNSQKQANDHGIPELLQELFPHCTAQEIETIDQFLDDHLSLCLELLEKQSKSREPPDNLPTANLTKP